MRHHLPICPLRSSPQKKASPSSCKGVVLVEKVIHYVTCHMDDDKLTAMSLADHVNLSVSQLNRQLNTLVGYPAGQYIWQLKMKHAAYLLRNNDYSVGRISGEVGFSYQAHFCRSFKKHFRCTPSEYRSIHNS